MPEDNQAGLGDASTGQVAESSNAALPESATNEPDATPTTEESTTTDVVDADSVWDSPLEFPATATDEDGTSNTADKPAEKGEATDNESDTTDREAETDADTDTDEPESDDTDTETEVSETDAVQDADKPAPLSRRKREAAVKSIIEPFRDENVPTSQVFDALYELNPTRAQALAAEIAESSAQAFPDLWLSNILGEEVTVESVKERLQGVQTGEAAGATASANSIPNGSLSDTSQAAADYKEVVDHLTDLYGEDWKDPNKDDDLFTEDRLYVDVVRKHLAGQSVSAEKQSEKDAEIERLTNELNSLKPEIENIKTAQHQEVELKIEEAYTNAAREYQSTLEHRSLDKFFEQAGLKDSPDDSDAVKQAKSFVRSRYDRERSGDFDNFVITKFGEREALMKMVERVDKNLKTAADAEVRASKTANKTEADKLRTAANAAREDAKREQDRLTVLHRKASQEFLKAELGFVNDLLEQIADRDRRLAQQGRTEVIGASTPGDSNNMKEKLANAADPWEVDTFADAFANVGR